MKHQELTDALGDRVTLYALGMLGPEETQAVAAHCAAGCALCMAELQDVAWVVDLLGYNAPAVQPRPEVRSRLLASLAPEAPYH